MTEAVDPDIETLLRGYELYNAGDFNALAELMSPDVVLHRDGGQPPVEGRDELLAFMEPDAFEYQHLHPEEVTRNGDRFLIRVRVAAKGAGSEIELEMTGWHVWETEGGIAKRLVATFDEEKARAEAGLL